MVKLEDDDSADTDKKKRIMDHNFDALGKFFVKLLSGSNLGTLDYLTKKLIKKKKRNQTSWPLFSMAQTSKKPKQ